MAPPLHVTTPLLLSPALSELMSNDVTSCDVYLKMDSCQPTGSFKMRGVGNSAQQAVLSGAQHLVCSSGGNAGIACSRAARILGVPCTIFVPTTTPALTVQRLQREGASVVVDGAYYNDAQENALNEAKKPGVTFVSPYDHPDVWAGNATLVTELFSQLPSKPGALVVSVGGGGLICGILEGLDAVGWSDVPVIAMETKGADCFNLSVKANKIVPLEKITSIALTLAARTVTPHLMDILPRYDVISEVVTDKQALSSCLRFADDERQLVEPSCGAALAAVYTGLLRSLSDEGKIAAFRKDRPVVVVVCGGSSVSIEKLKQWSEQLDEPFPRGAQ